MRLFIGILLFFTILSSCSEDTTNYEVGSGFLDDSVEIRVIDTFSIKSGTFRKDSLVTSSTSRILLGNINDPELGTLSSKSYFQLLTTDFDIETTAVYDSIGFIMNYDTYYYGDTLKPQSYKLYKLREEVELDDDNLAFYSTDELEIEPGGPIGEIIDFYPKPNKASDSLYIPIDDTLGTMLFESIQDNNVTTSDDLLNIFKGIVIEPDTNSYSHILGFNVNTIEGTAGNTCLRLYYTDDDGDSDSHYTIDFVIPELSKQFNNISSTAPYENDIVISSEETGNVTYLQAGSGIATKIEIPSIKKLKELSNVGATLSAELTFNASILSFVNSEDITEEDQQLNVSIINNKNELLGALTDIDGNTVYANVDGEDANGDGIIDDNEFDNSTFYSVDLSGFVDIILSSEEDLEYSLMIQFPDNNKTAEKAIIKDSNDSENGLKLSVKYLTYE